MDDWRPNAGDRCDGQDCGAQAWVRTDITGKPLLWCGSHYRRFEAGLVAKATRIWDFRFMLDMQ